VHNKSAILEETHYYPFGLAIAPISSKAANGTENKYQYNGKEEQRQEFSDGSGLDWLDFSARMYDNQLGRWMNVDRLSEISRRWSPYSYTYNNPIRYIDPSGMAVEETPTSFRFSGADAIALFSVVKANYSMYHPDGNNDRNDGPGMWYPSQDAAAAGWARTYGEASAEFDGEFVSIIYYFIYQDKVYYSFTAPNISEGTHGEFPEIPYYAPAGATECATIHTHPWSGKDYTDNELSNTDYFHTDGKTKGDIQYYQDEGRWRSWYLLAKTGQLKVLRNQPDPNDNDPYQDVIGGGFAKHPRYLQYNNNVVNYDNEPNSPMPVERNLVRSGYFNGTAAEQFQALPIFPKDKKQQTLQYFIPLYFVTLRFSIFF
jgi:RHS repeat-associated protein